MNKITLMDIMESLNSENTDDAAAALHEWFVEAARNVHAGLTGETVMEAPLGLTFGTESADESNIEIWSFESEDDAHIFYRVAGRAADIWPEAEVPGLKKVPAGTMAQFDTAQDIYDWMDGVGYEYANIKTEEGRVDELSRDTMMAYAKKARVSRDRESDEEKVGRRVTGLGMVADKARREKADLQYESDIEEAVPAMFDPEQNQHAANAADSVNHDNAIRDSERDFLVSQISAGLTSGKHEGQAEDVDLPDGRLIEFAWAIVDHGVNEIPFQLIMKGTEHAGGSPGEYIGHDFIDYKGQNVGVAYVVWDRPTSDEIRKQEGKPAFGEAIEESVDDLIAELTEAFHGLETVSDKLQNVEGAQVGEEGKVPVNKKSTLPSKEGDKRVGGEAVEIKSKGHTGHALEKAPKVKDAPVKHHVQNSKDDPKKVGAEKGALLNKMDGSVNTQSPISGKGAKGLKK